MFKIVQFHCKFAEILIIFPHLTSNQCCDGDVCDRASFIQLALYFASINVTATVLPYQFTRKNNNCQNFQTYVTS